MRFNSVKGGDYSSGARAVNKNADAAFDASRKSGFNFTKISKTAQSARETRRRAAIKGEQLKDTTQIKADTLVKGTQLKVDTDNAVNDKLRPAKRMAGMVAGLGAASTGIINLNEAKAAKAERATLKAERDQITQRSLALQEQSVRDREAIMSLYNSRRDGESTIATSDSPSSTVSSTGTSSGSSTTLPTGTPTKTSKGTLYSKSDLQSFATQAGFTPSEAATMSRIGLAESGGYAGNDTVQSGMDPGQNNEYSIGLWQINTQAHMDKLTRRGWGKEDLRDPVKNATIAKEVYDEMGGSFEPWGAFTNGSYQKH